jgi:TRAP-type C4-dicarboxylate transport system substrate-binding protein
MKTVNFLILSIIILIVTVALSMPSFAADKIKLTFATTLAPKSTIELAAKQYADVIGKKTGGRINIIHYGGGSLYNAKDLIPALAKNQVNMGVHHVAMVGRRSGILEFISSFGAQGAWNSFDHYYRFIDNAEIRALADAEFDKYFNAKLLGMMAYGTSMFACVDKAVQTVEDFKGLKIRSSGSAQATLYKALGAIGVEMSSQELYTALQRGTIQGSSTGTSRTRRARLYEVAPYLTNDPTIPFCTFWLVINKDVWKKLPAEDRKLMMEEAQAIEAWTRDFAAKERKEDIDIIRSKAKMVYDMTPEQKQEMIAVARPAMMAYSKKRLGDKYQMLWDFLDKTK